MLTEIPVKDWIGCRATPSSLSSLVGAIVPGQLRKLETVFEVVGLQVLGISSVKSDTDQLAHRFLCQMQESSSVRGVVHVYIAAHMRTRAHASIYRQVVNYLSMGHPPV